jgi:hypothetical protein
MLNGHNNHKLDQYKLVRMMMFTMVRLMGDPKTAPKTPEQLWELPGDQDGIKIDEEEYKEIFKRLAK